MAGNSKRITSDPPTGIKSADYQKDRRKRPIADSIHDSATLGIGHSRYCHFIQICRRGHDLHYAMNSYVKCIIL